MGGFTPLTQVVGACAFGALALSSILAIGQAVQVDLVTACSVWTGNVGLGPSLTRFQA